jgi:hypothetical protein
MAAKQWVVAQREVLRRRVVAAAVAKAVGVRAGEVVWRNRQSMRRYTTIGVKSLKVQACPDPLRREIFPWLSRYV